jgi:hypothetical protein
MTLRTRNDAVLQTLTPFLVAMPDHAALLDRSPFGLAIEPSGLIDPTRLASERFLHLLQTLDKLTFGPEGMPMPRWVFYNCAEIPGAIFGFARKVEDLPQGVREQLGIEEGERGLVPLSMYIAIPVGPPDVWFGHNLASLNPTFPELGLRGLASITKALALKTFRCDSQIGATQWDSSALHIHSRFGPLELLTAWTPAHSESATLTYRFDVTDLGLRHAFGDPQARLSYPDATEEIRAVDYQAMMRLQRRIEAGERFVVAGPPRGSGDDLRVPVAGPLTG